MTGLVGKVAVVTGGSKGIGAAMCKALAANGARVVVNYASSEEAAGAVVKAIVAAGGQAIAVRGDVSRRDHAQELIETAAQEFGGIDIIINNAGVYDIVSIEDVTEELYRRTFDVNVLGPLLVIQAALKHLGEGGSIVNISSSATSLAPPASSVYTGTKGAIEGITKVLANELGPRGIRVNAICPGLVHTEGIRAAGLADSDFERFAVSRTPLGRVGQPDDVADVAVFLASDQSRWLTGERVLVSGGFR